MRGTDDDGEIVLQVGRGGEHRHGGRVGEARADELENEMKARDGGGDIFRLVSTVLGQVRADDHGDFDLDAQRVGPLDGRAIIEQRRGRQG